MKAIRQVLRYVKGTKDYGITYKHNGGNKIHGYSDSSYGVNNQEGKGTTGIIFYYGESPISWSTQKQATVALSSCESEFIVATAATTQVLWLKRLLSKLTHSQEEKVTIQVDNKSAIALMKNPVFHGRSKHIDMKYHFIRECVEKEDIQVEFINGEYQKADILTKALLKIKFLTIRQLIRLKDLRHSIFREFRSNKVPLVGTSADCGDGAVYGDGDGEGTTIAGACTGVRMSYGDGVWLAVGETVGTAVGAILVVHEHTFLPPFGSGLSIWPPIYSTFYYLPQFKMKYLILGFLTNRPITLAYEYSDVYATLTFTPHTNLLQEPPLVYWATPLTIVVIDA
ncbi:hypothetical protein Tco_0729189 [Tanacetum coccineum]|uniref:Uncharacterized protein n=1 Tax=Tanacetum coccineum TaxID=301880 RepID=A0ABQ4YRC0_9ASTR